MSVDVEPQPPPVKFAVLPHMGLGDMIVQKGILRKLSELADEVIVFGKAAYRDSLESLYWDLPNVFVALVEDSWAVSPVDGADGRAWAQLEKQGFKVLPLGKHTASSAWMSLDCVWSKCLYRSLGLLPSVMYDAFSIERSAVRNRSLLERTLLRVGPRFALVHDDPARDMTILSEWLPPDLPTVHVDDPAIRSNNISDYCDLIENAQELHFIESSFALLADFMFEPGSGPKRFVHVTPGRPGTPQALYRGSTVVRHGSGASSSPDAGCASTLTAVAITPDGKKTSF